MKKYLSLLLTTFISFTYVTIATSANEFNDDFTQLIAISKDRVKIERIEKTLLKRQVHFKNKIILNNLSFNVIELSSQANKATVINDLKNTGLFKVIEPDYILKSDYIVNRNAGAKLQPNDVDFKYQYYLDTTNVTKAWLLSTGAANMPIAVLDSGVNYLSKDLYKRVLPCANVLSSYGYSCLDDYGHGTKVTSIIGAEVDNNLATAGITWLNPILPIRISNEQGIASVSTIIQGLNEAIKNQVKIAVISLSTNAESLALEEAISEAYQSGILIVASGGNTGIDEIRYPAGFDEVIGVGSTDKNLNISYFSTKGNHIDLVAPGEDILVQSLDDGYLEEVSGTSFTVPQIAAIAALVWAVRPEYTNEDIKKILFKTTKDLGEEGYDTEYGYGLVNAKRAVKWALFSSHN